MTHLNRSAAKKYYEEHGDAPRRKFLRQAFQNRYMYYLSNIYSSSTIDDFKDMVKAYGIGFIGIVFYTFVILTGPLVVAATCTYQALRNHKHLQKYIKEEIE